MDLLVNESRSNGARLVMVDTVETRMSVRTRCVPMGETPCPFHTPVNKFLNASSSDRSVS